MPNARVTGVIRGAVRLLRPRQWIKNVLVAAAPLAAGTLLQGETLGRTALAFVSFCLASSATYCINDVMDAESDARHPTKRHRPVASGKVSRPMALIMAALLAAAALALVGPLGFRLVVLGYLAVTVLYSVWLKHQPVLELGLVSAGFLLRAVGGGLATELPLSRWFLIVTAFGSLLMVTGKRLSELTAAKHASEVVRKSLTFYPLSFLRMILAVTVAVTITGYCLWAFEVGAQHSGGVWSAISVAPFVLALLRYSLDCDLGRAEEPEQVVLRDRTLQALGLLWLATFSAGVLM
jgi:decaprenyl-phosphate phosphoribosyltransferase